MTPPGTPRKRTPAKKAPAKRAPAKKTALSLVPPPPPPPEDVFDPRLEAHRLRLRGTPWAEVAKVCGYASQETARLAVQGYLQEAAIARDSATQQMALQTQIERYEAILLEWWTLGTTGRDEKAAAILLKTLAQLDRVQALGEVRETGAVRALVINGNDGETYLTQLKQVVEGRTESPLELPGTGDETGDGPGS